MVRFGVPGQNVDSLSYADSRLSTVPVVNAPRRPTVNDKKYPMWCEWRVNKEATAPATEGEFWKLIRFESNGDATWVQLDVGGGLPGVDDLRDQVDVQVTPDASGNIDIDGATVSNGANPSSIPLETVADPGTNTLDVQIQIGTAVTPTPADPNDAGILSANEDHFSVDATSGMFSLKGGGVTPAVTKTNVDFNTAPGVDPVVADANGQINIRGNTVTNGKNTNAPVATHSRAVNTFQVDVQQATAVSTAPADPFDVGLSSYNSNQFDITSNGWVSLNSSHSQTLGFSNLGFEIDTGVFSVRGADADLSSTNFGTVTLFSKANSGQVVTVKVTANQSFQDGNATSEITGNLFGLTTGVASTQNILFTVYAVLNDDEDNVQFMLCRLPGLTVSPVVANIGAPDDAVADIQSAFWSLDNIDETLYDENPCVGIGTILMMKDASDDWTVSAVSSASGLGDSGIGPGSSGVNKGLVMPAGQFGAASGKRFTDNGGTAPGFNGFFYNYILDAENLLCSIDFQSGNNNVTGVGAVTAELALPFILGPNGSTARQYIAGGAVFFDSSAGTYTNLVVNIPDSSNLASFYLNGGTAKLQNQDFQANDRIFGFFTYRISNNE